MIVLSTLTSGSSIELEIDYAKSVLSTASRRVNRTATLDGGVVITDTGFAHGDRTLTLVAINVDHALADSIDNFHQDNTVIRLAMYDGVYKAVIRTKSIKDGTARLTVWLKEKES